MCDLTAKRVRWHWLPRAIWRQQTARRATVNLCGCRTLLLRQTLPCIQARTLVPSCCIRKQNVTFGRCKWRHHEARERRCCGCPCGLAHALLCCALDLRLRAFVLLQPVFNRVANTCWVIRFVPFCSGKTGTSVANRSWMPGWSCEWARSTASPRKLAEAPSEIFSMVS